MYQDYTSEQRTTRILQNKEKPEKPSKMIGCFSRKSNGKIFKIFWIFSFLNEHNLKPHCRHSCLK